MKSDTIRRIIVAIAAVLVLVCCGISMSHHAAMMKEIAAAEGTVESDYVSGDMISSLKNGFELTFLDDERRGALFDGLFITVSLVLIAVFVGVIAGIIMFSVTYRGRFFGEMALPGISRFMSFVPPSTLVILVFYVFLEGGGRNTFVPAAIGLSISFSFKFYECVRSAFEEISQGEKDAAATMGYSPYQALFKVFLPGMLPALFDESRNAVIDLIQNSTVVELIGVYDVQMVADIIASETGEPFFPLLYMTAALILFCYSCSKAVQSLNIDFKIEKSEEEIRDRIGRGIF